MCSEECEKVCGVLKCKKVDEYEVEIKTKLYGVYNNTSVYYLEEGDSGANGKKVSKEFASCLKRHENGHKTDFDCIGRRMPDYDGKEKLYTIKACNTTESLSNAVDVVIKNDKEEFEKMLKNVFDDASDKFHKNFGTTVMYNNDGKVVGCPSEGYACPSDLK